MKTNEVEVWKARAKRKMVTLSVDPRSCLIRQRLRLTHLHLYTQTRILLHVLDEMCQIHYYTPPREHDCHFVDFDCNLAHFAGISGGVRCKPYDLDPNTLP